jgi:hypothetical protein
LRFRRAAANAKLSADHELAWARRWAVASGILLLAGFLLPIVTASAWTSTMIWSWDLLEGAPINAMLSFLAIPVAGVIILIVAFTLPPKGVAQIMVWLGAIVLVIQLILSPIAQQMMSSGSSGMDIPAGIVGGLFSLTACGVAVANRIRKRHPGHPLPRGLAFFSGLGLLIMTVIPFGGERSVLSGFIDADLWRHGWAIGLSMLLYLSYGVAGLVSVRPFKVPRIATQVVSLMGRTLLGAIPISLLVTILTAINAVGGGSTLTPVLMGILKLCALWYGLLALPAAGAAAWISTSIGPGESPPEAPKGRKLIRPLAARKPVSTPASSPSPIANDSPPPDPPSTPPN